MLYLKLILPIQGACDLMTFIPMAVPWLLDLRPYRAFKNN